MKKYRIVPDDLIDHVWLLQERRWLLFWKTIAAGHRGAMVNTLNWILLAEDEIAHDRHPPK